MASDMTLKILAVDDTPQNLLALQALIDVDGVQLLSARSGTEALELLLQHEVALALLDVQMPGIDGYTLAELMRGTERTRHVPIIFLTASGAEAQRAFRGYEAGAVDFIVKPLDPMALRSKVRVFLDLHRQRVQLAERVAEHERLQRVHRLMLSALSYDIREPLTALALNAELLLRRGDDTGHRVKAATTLLSHHVDHLVNLVAMPCDNLRPQLRMGSLHELVRQRLDQPSVQLLMRCAPTLECQGDDQARFDPALLAEAVDHLLLQAAAHAGDGPVRVQVDGDGRHAVTLRLQFDSTLSAAASKHLLGGQDLLDGLLLRGTGPGLGSQAAAPVYQLQPPRPTQGGCEYTSPAIT
jgi:two-component system sensor histidine kinase/response regulator